jgi:hypothetical protein
MKNSAKKNLAPAPGDEFLTTEEAAKRLKRSAKTLEYWRTAGLGPPFYRQQRRRSLSVERNHGLGSQLPRRPPKHRGLNPAQGDSCLSGGRADGQSSSGLCRAQ